jgi:hypothetical protein
VHDEICRAESVRFDVGVCGEPGRNRKCHGSAGQGSKKAPPVVGKDAFPLDPRPGQKRDVKFHTAADVFVWATKHMPPKHEGTLSTEQWLAIFAFDLTANGVKLDQPLDAAKAQAIVLHP